MIVDFPLPDVYKRQEVNGEPNYAWADQLTREQAAALFYRFAKLMGKA